MITDEMAPEEIVEELRGKGVTVHQVRKADFTDAASGRLDEP